MKLGTKDTCDATVIIAELGISHRGHEGWALAYMDDAADAGADGVKMQYQWPEKDLTQDHPWRQTLEACALPHEAHRRIRDHAREIGLIYGVTPFCVEAVERCVDLEPDYIKVGGGGWSNVPMMEALEKVADDIPIVVSLACGLKEAPEWAMLVLACVSKYPTPLREAVYAARYALEGLSDHSGSSIPGMIAIARELEMLEVHFPRIGPDAASSLPHTQLEQLCRVRDAMANNSNDSRPEHDPEVVKLAKHRKEHDWRRAGDCYPAGSVLGADGRVTNGPLPPIVIKTTL